jgi:hypothetical protein
MPAPSSRPPARVGLLALELAAIGAAVAVSLPVPAVAPAAGGGDAVGVGPRRQLGHGAGG